MNRNQRKIDRRSFLKLPALLPLAALDATFRSKEHYFQYECVIGTSLDLVVWAPSSKAAASACWNVLGEIERLRLILDTRDPSSEIAVMDHLKDFRRASPELAEVLGAYHHWERRTEGIFSCRPNGANNPLNVDALGKAYIIDRAAKAARNTCPGIDALLLNIGGDIVVWGRSCDIAIADSDAWYDNANPIKTIRIQNAAVATSGTYARGGHLIDARIGQSHTTATAATVVAADAVTANALATTLCLIEAGRGLELVESTSGAEALRIASGVMQQTSGFHFLERQSATQTTSNATQWPVGYQLTITLPLTAGRSKKRPYVAVWVEDAKGDIVRLLAFWGNNSKYHADLSTIWSLTRKSHYPLRDVTRATRPAGKYELLWDGLDTERKPVPLGEYRITVETNQEHGTYAKQAGTIAIGDTPTSITLPATTSFDTVLIRYGPK